MRPISALSNMSGTLTKISSLFALKTKSEEKTKIKNKNLVGNN
jgi:hypothetical protein